MADRPVIVWFRLDLRTADHAALTEAAKSGAAVLPLYILDDETPGRFRMGGASRWWLHGSLDALARALSQSRLADPAYRAQLWEGGAAAIATSGDPMIQFVRLWDGAARAVRWLTAWSYAVRALAALFIPRQPAKVYRAHARQALHPERGESIRDRVEAAAG